MNPKIKVALGQLATLMSKAFKRVGNPNDYKARLGWFDRNIVDRVLGLAEECVVDYPEDPDLNQLRWQRGLVCWELGFFEKAEIDLDYLAHSNWRSARLAQENLIRIRARKSTVDD